MPKAKKPKTRKPRANKPIVYDELTWPDAQKLVKGGMDMAIMPPARPSSMVRICR